MNQGRQPKGTPVGGQFTEGRKPDGGDLAAPGRDEDHEYDEYGRCERCGALRPGLRAEVWADTRIANAYSSWRNARDMVDREQERLYYYVLPRSMQRKDTRFFVVDDVVTPTTVDAIRNIFESGRSSVGSLSSEYITSVFERYDQAYDAMVSAAAAYREESARYKGWSRFFMVPDGHIHSSMQCSTCNKNGNATEFNWLPELSGLDESDAVEAHGAVLCTVCFPTAPVEYTNKFDLEKDARAKNRCPGSGTVSEQQWVRGTHCPVCHAWVSVNISGRLRSHNKPAT